MKVKRSKFKLERLISFSSNCADPQVETEFRWAADPDKTPIHFGCL